MIQREVSESRERYGCSRELARTRTLCQRRCALQSSGRRSPPDEIPPDSSPCVRDLGSRRLACVIAQVRAEADSSFRCSSAKPREIVCARAALDALMVSSAVIHFLEVWLAGVC